jgi:hypothetical protein
MKNLLLLFVFFYSCVTSVHASTFKGIEMDCAGAGPEAVVDMPVLFQSYAEIKCTIYGHLIAAPDGVSWHDPEDPSPVLIPAQIVRAQPKQRGHNAYFRKVSATKLDGAEAKRVYTTFMRSYKGNATVMPEVLELVAINAKNVEQVLYIFNDIEDKVWAYTCQPSCRPDLPFLVVNTQR